MLIKILGSGSSGGVPLIGPYWGDCNPNNPKNKRSRVSIAIEILNKTILIDTSPDLREQSIDCNINKIDAVLWTHAHADHVNGIDDIRQFLWKRKEKLPVFASRETLDTLKRRFDYVFDNNNAYFKPPLDPKSVNPGYFNIHNIKILAIEQFHGKEITYGYRINNFAYSTDVNSFPENSFKKAVIVVGNLGDQVVNKFGTRYRGIDITYIENVDYEKTGAVYSLWLAKEYLDGSSIIIECDTIFENEILKELISQDEDKSFWVGSKFLDKHTGCKLNVDKNYRITNLDLVKKASNNINGYKSIGLLKISGVFAGRLVECLDNHVIESKEDYFGLAIKKLLEIEELYLLDAKDFIRMATFAWPAALVIIIVMIVFYWVGLGLQPIMIGG